MVIERDQLRTTPKHIGGSERKQGKFKLASLPQARSPKANFVLAEPKSAMAPAQIHAKQTQIAQEEPPTATKMSRSHKKRTAGASKKGQHQLHQLNSVQVEVTHAQAKHASSMGQSMQIKDGKRVGNHRASASREDTGKIDWFQIVQGEKATTGKKLHRNFRKGSPIYEVAEDSTRSSVQPVLLNQDYFQKYSQPMIQHAPILSSNSIASYTITTPK